MYSKTNLAMITLDTRQHLCNAHFVCTKDTVLCMFIVQVFYYTVFQKKTSTHIIGYKLRNSCPILIIFDIKIPHIIWHRKTA